MPFVAATSDRLASPDASTEKFRDTWWDEHLGGRGRETTPKPYATTSEPYYLRDVPANAAARIDAMMRWAADPKHQRPSPGVNAIRDAGAAMRARDEKNDAAAAAEAKKIAQAMASAGAAGAAVGVALEATIAVARGIAGIVRARAAAEEEEAQAAFNQASADTLAAGFPPLWNLLLSAEAWGGSPLGLAQLAQAHLLKWDALPAKEARAVQAWWSMAVRKSSDPTVKSYFHSMPTGFGTGASLGSDEQIMLVTAPIAATYGIPLRELALATWQQTPGWRTRPDLFFPAEDGTIANVHQINAALMAETAFRIAERQAAEQPANAAAAKQAADLAALPSSLGARALAPATTTAGRAVRAAGSAAGLGILIPLARFLIRRIV